MAETQVVASKEQNRFFPFVGLYHTMRNSFFAASQDSFTYPPAQDPDLFERLTNIDPIQYGTLTRRRGYTFWANPAISGPYILGFVYENFETSNRRLLWCTPPLASNSNQAYIDAFNESGSVYQSDIYNTSSIPWITASRSYAYISGGTTNEKWHDTLGKSTWGLDVNAQTGQSYGPNIGTGSSGTNWTNPGYVWQPAGSAAAATQTGSSTEGAFVTTALNATNLGFSIPSGYIVSGIVVTGYASGGELETGVSAQILINGVATGTAQTQGTTGSVGGYLSFQLGSSTNVWGAYPLYSDVNSTSFGIQIQVSGYGNPTGNPKEYDWTAKLNGLTVTIYVSAVAITLGTPASGAITLSIGRKYTYVFANSVTGNTSDLGPFSASTGALSSKDQPLSGIPKCTDTQCDTVILLATADGGDETTLYYLATVTNGTSTYTDDTDEIALEASNVYQETDIYGIEHGVAYNTPPPQGMTYTIQHRGRIFGLVGEFLFFSKNLDEVTTSTGTICGRWEEDWPAINQFYVSTGAEMPVGLMSDGTTLYILTPRKIHRLIGDSPENFIEPDVVFSETGVLNQLVIQRTFLEDQPIGVIWMSPDFRVIMSDMNTYQDIGTPIQDVLLSTNPAAIQNCFSCYVNDNAFDLYMLYIPTGSNTYPDTCCVYNLRSKSWVIWKPTDQVTGALFNINASGIPQWLFGTNAGPVYYWDASVFQDRNNNTPVSYAATMRTSWQNLGDMTIRKGINQCLVYTDDANLTLTFEGAQGNQTNFDSPQNLVSNAAISYDPFGEYFVPLAVYPTRHFWYRLTFTSPATSTVERVLSGFDLECLPIHRY